MQTATETIQGSEQQEAFWREIEEGESHVVLEALAGTGKSFSIREAMRRLPRGTRAVYAAFNKHIADEFQRGLPPGCFAATLHSIGFAAIRRVLPGVVVDDKKIRNIVESLVAEEETRRTLARLVELAKGQGLTRDDRSPMIELADRFDVPPREGPKGRKDGDHGRDRARPIGPRHLDDRHQRHAQAPRHPRVRAPPGRHPLHRRGPGLEPGPAAARRPDLPGRADGRRRRPQPGNLRLHRRGQRIHPAHDERPRPDPPRGRHAPAHGHQAMPPPRRPARRRDRAGARGHARRRRRAGRRIPRSRDDRRDHRARRDGALPGQRPPRAVRVRRDPGRQEGRDPWAAT